MPTINRITSRTLTAGSDCFHNILSRFVEKSSKVLPHLGGLSAGGGVGDTQAGGQGVQEVAPGEVVLEAETPQQDLSKTSPGWLQS